DGPRNRVVSGGAICLAHTMNVQQTVLQSSLRDARKLAPASDYEIVRRAIAFISENYRDQPEVEAIAEAAGTDSRALTELFRRWCGLTPKEFLAAVTLDHARKILRESPSVLDASFELGL